MDTPTIWFSAHPAAANTAASLRTVTFMGREFRVIPAVLVRSQVLHNNLGSTFLPPETITDDWASLWNGIPVLVGDHPTERGVHVSGRQPELWESRGAGWIFNTRAESDGPGVRRLVGEVWLDISRAATVPGLQAVLERIEAGGAVELSTGFPVETVDRVGEFAGQQYEIVMRPLGADHLVISTEMRGACSVDNGCGLGVNEEAGEGARMNLAQRALQFLTSFEVKNAMRILGRSAQNSTKVQWDENTARVIARESEALNGLPTSDMEHSAMLREQLQERLGNADRTVVVCDVYRTEKWVVFFMLTPFGPEPRGSEYYRTSYSEQAGMNGKFEFSEPLRVRRMTVYEEVASAPAADAAQQETPVVGEESTEVVNNSAPCGCGSGTPAAEQTHEDVAMTPEERKELMDAAAAAFGAQMQSALAQHAEQSNTQTQSAITAAIAPIREQVVALTAQVNAENTAKKQAIVTELSTNNRTPFTADELSAKSLDELVKLATLAHVEVDAPAFYGGRGMPRTTSAANSEPEYMPVAAYHQKPAAVAAKE
jgi:hypothetical protein